MSDEILVRRARRGDVGAVARLVQSATQGEVQIDEVEVMDWLFGKGMMVAGREDSVLGVATWQAENLVSVTDAFYIASGEAQGETGRELLAAIEVEANTLMCEANIVLLRPSAPPEVYAVLQEQGYVPKEHGELHRIWREVLDDLAGEVPCLMVKRLRDRMVMVPL